MEIRTTARPNCPLCASHGDLLYKDLEDNLFNAPGKWQLRRCANKECALCWLDPVAIASDLGLLYANYHTHGEKNSIGLRAKIRSFLLRGYELAKFIPSGLFGLNQEKRQFPYMFLNDLTPGRVLDVGCGIR